MANADFSKKLLKIFEGLVTSCCQHYQMLLKEDQLKALKMMKNTALRFELKQEGDVIKEEYFEHDTTLENSDLKVKEELGLTDITEDHQHQTGESDAETFQQLNIKDLDTSEAGSGEDELMENKNNLKRTLMDPEDHACKRLRGGGDDPSEGTIPIISHNMELPQDSLSSNLQTMVRTIVKSTMEEKALNRSKSEHSNGVAGAGSTGIISRRNSWSAPQMLSWSANQRKESSRRSREAAAEERTSWSANQSRESEETSLLRELEPSSTGELSFLGNSSSEPWYQDIGCDNLTLTTRGPSLAAQNFGSCLGRFVPMETTPNCFVQKHSKSGRKLMMTRSPLTSFTGWLWTVRFEKDCTPVFQNVTEDSGSVPTKGWQWWDLKLSAWKYDLSLSMEAFSPCGTITITVRGAATEILPEKSVFKPKQGEWFSGRQV